MGSFGTTLYFFRFGMLLKLIESSGDETANEEVDDDVKSMLSVLIGVRFRL